ncbi:hypothetical protein OAU50_03555 [Planctomycetota bacterium]|nr:hypothetical protein [Planctomycetota bacterium]
MATQEVTLRPGDTLSLLIDVPGQPMKLDLNLTPAGVEVSSPLPVGAPTQYGGPPPSFEAGPVAEPMPDPIAEEEPVDLDAQFAKEDSAPAQPSINDVQSLAAVEAFDSPPAAPVAPAPAEVAIEEVAEELPEEVFEDGGASDEDFDMDLGDDDLGLGEDLGLDDGGIDIPEDDGGIDIPSDDDLGMVEDSLDIPEDDDLSMDDGGIDIPEDDEDLSLGVDDEPGFVADGATMVPPTASADLALDDGLGLEDEPADALEEENMDGKEKHQPNEDDTLPVWNSKASTYKDPEIETKKKHTAKINAKPITKNVPIGKKGPLKKAALPGKKGPLPGKRGPLPGKKPTGQVAPLAKKATGQVAPPAASGGTGNFTVFLSPPRTPDKKETAAEIIAEVQGVDIDTAKTLAGKMIIKVINGVSEDEAQGVRDKFKDAGLSCRITKKR